MSKDSTTFISSGFPKHEKYKPSGVDWLGEVPEHWHLISLRNVLTEVSEKGFADLPLLSITRELGIIERDVDDQEGNHNFIPPDLSGYKRIKEGNFGMNKMKAWQGSYGVSDFTGIVSPAYFVYSLNDALVPSFFHWAVRSKVYVGEMAKSSDGVRIGQWDLSKQGLKEIRLAVPINELEQKAIVNFLDAKTKEIEETIKQKQRTIELLEEYKHSLIEQAVTKGLDPSAPMKDSGVDWLGEVPEHWNRHRLKKFLSVSKTLVGRDWEKYDLLSLTLNGVILRDMENPEGKFPSDFSTYQVVKPGQLILCLFDVEETPRTVGLSGHHGMITGAYDVFDLLNIHAQFFYYWYLSLDQHKNLRSLYRGLRNTISMPRLQAMDIFLPDFGQQKDIVNFLDAKTKEIEEAKSSIQVQIDHLKEYKDSLIESAVTGKIKVA